MVYLAKQLYRARTDEKVIREVLEMVTKNAVPPLSFEETQGIIDRAIEIGNKKERSIMDDVRQWVEVTEGHFRVTDCHRESQTVTKEDKHAVVMALKRLCEQGVIEKYGNERGVYRKIENQVQEIDWEDCDDTIIDVKWPFGLEKYYMCFPKNIVVITGSPDAGKTAFCLNFSAMNIGKYPINYFSNEMGPFELKSRLKKFGFPIKNWKAIKFIERSTNFADAIRSDEINIVDYIEVPEEAWKIVTPINDIWRKLDKGMCLIALQRPRNRDIARGGEGTLDRPRLYLSMGNGKIEIIKCKNWVEDTLNPKGYSLEYKIVQGCNFIQESEWGISSGEIRK